MTASEVSRYVRLRVELVLEIVDSGELTSEALDRIAADETMPDEERAHAQSAVREEGAEAIAYLIDPFDLVSEMPGVELAQASWSTEQVDHGPEGIEFDPDAEEWDQDEEDGEGDAYSEQDAKADSEPGPPRQ
ncbi:hypothetical protein ACIHCQ_04865 [Streptomyces sp. NPDC052236]|uniref:hypothetical protein n=1 Tax=Streptomyces sp. NPDC052236 TaxID=3365686 RepID=UPI0037D40827